MDYKYIEQLLERYWECKTSLEEERILRTFFRQEGLPDRFMKYKALFEYEDQASQLKLGTDFDERLIRLVGASTETPQETVVKAKRLTFSQRLRPLYRAAAIVAVFLMVGNAVQYTFHRQSATTGWDYNAANYQDTYAKPLEALEAGMGGIEEIRNLLRTPHYDATDTLTHKTPSKQ